MSLDASSLIEAGKVIGFILIASFILLGSLWLRFKFPVDEYGCPLNIDPFDLRKDLKNGKNNTIAVLGSSESTLEGGKSGAGNEEEAKCSNKTCK